MQCKLNCIVVSSMLVVISHLVVVKDAGAESLLKKLHMTWWYWSRYCGLTLSVPHFF